MDWIVITWSKYTVCITETASAFTDNGDNTTEDKLWEIPFQQFKGAKLWRNLPRKKIKKSKENKELTREIIYKIHLSLSIPSK